MLSGQDFVEEYNRKRGNTGDQRLDAMTLCARTDSEVVVGAYDKVASKFKNNDDIWLVPIEIAMKGWSESVAGRPHISHRIFFFAEDNARVGVEGAGRKRTAAHCVESGPLP